MKVLVAQFITESNEHIPFLTQLEDYMLCYGDECIRQMNLGTAFQDAGIEIIPAIYANGASGGIVAKTAFEFIEKRIIQEVKKHRSELDGIFLHLHGASEVEELEGGSGEHHIVKTIRSLVGPYLPIAVVCDPHGNLSKEYVDNITILRDYRESPHTDMNETVQKVAGMLAELLQNRENIRPEYRKLPMILGGEQSVSADEPVRTINQKLDELEQDERIWSCSWHVGYIRHDCEIAGCSVVVVPRSGDAQEYAAETADKLAEYIWSRRHEFHYTGLTKQPDEAMRMAVEHVGKPVFLTDSGDNVTSGAAGCNTQILRQVLALNHTKDKKFLFAAIADVNVLNQLLPCEIGEKQHIKLGMEYDELSQAVELDVTVKKKGVVEGYMNYEGIYGPCVTVSVDGKPIDIVVEADNKSFAELHQFAGAGIDCDDYDVIVVKQGYIFPELKEKGSLSIMSLTPGATYQDTASLSFKRIMRPMFPIDDI